MSPDAMLSTLLRLVVAVSWLLLQTAAGGDIKLQRIVPAEQLKCYFCYELDPACIDMSNVTSLLQQDCRLNEPFCKTERITQAGQLTSFSRRCSPDCKGGCLWADDIQRCIECCTHSMCNVGIADSAAPLTCSARVHHALVTFGLVTFVTLVLSQT